MSDPYGTHSAVLGELKPVCSAVEFGCGNYSTPILLEKTKHLVSVESDRSWYTSMVQKYRGQITSGRLTPIYGGLGTHLLFTSHFDLAFVDARRKFRLAIGQSLFDSRVNRIIFHDWEHQATYRYGELRIPSAYIGKIFTHDSGVETAVFSLTSVPFQADEHEVRDYIG